MTARSGLDESRDLGRVLLGSAVILIGVAILGERNDWWSIDLGASWWPVVPLLLGLVKFLVPGPSGAHPRSRRSGMWLISIGVWGMISEAELFGLEYSKSWPLLVVALGVNIVWRALEAPPIRRIQERS